MRRRALFISSGRRRAVAFVSGPIAVGRAIRSALFLRHMERGFQGLRLAGEFFAEGGERIVRAQVRAATRNLVAAYGQVPQIGFYSDLHLNPADRHDYVGPMLFGSLPVAGIMIPNHGLTPNS